MNKLPIDIAQELIDRFYEDKGLLHQDEQLNKAIDHALIVCEEIDRLLYTIKDDVSDHVIVKWYRVQRILEDKKPF